jgi:putative DNA-invertase from lambdoid prophage Rac
MNLCDLWLRSPPAQTSSRHHKKRGGVTQRRFPRSVRVAGIEHAKGRTDSPYLGRKPAFTRKQFETVRDMLAKGTANIAQIAKATGVKRPTVYRLKADPVAAEAALAAWGL